MDKPEKAECGSKHRKHVFMVETRVDLILFIPSMPFLLAKFFEPRNIIILPSITWYPQGMMRLFAHFKMWMNVYPLAL